MFSRSGDTNVVSLTDMFGFECFLRNHTEQLLINSLNEQLQYHYNQRMFAWEMLEQEEEQIPSTAYRYNDNKMAVDHLMTKPYGLFYIIDDATKGRMNYEFITGESRSGHNYLMPISNFIRFRLRQIQLSTRKIRTCSA